MKLDKNFKLNNDANNWILSYKSEKKTNPNNGKEFYSTDEWYFPSIGMALKKYVDQSLKPCKNVEEILAMLEEQNTLINNTFK